MITHYPIMSGRPPRERSRLVATPSEWRQALGLEAEWILEMEPGP